MKINNSYRLAFPFTLLIACLLHYPEKDPKTGIPTCGEGWKVVVGKNPSPETTAYRIDTPGVKTKMLPHALGDPTKESLFFNDKSLRKILKEKKPAKLLMGRSKNKRNVEAWYFPGSSDKKALVIGGVHGSELSAIEVATTLITRLKSGRNNYYSVIIVPCLFPDNAAMAEKKPGEIGSSRNIGRYSFPAATDPNRQMPGPGEPYNAELFEDHLGRKIEQENRLLLRLIQLFRPDRIVSIHGIRDLCNAGIFADPRADGSGHAMGFETDSSLAMEMASSISKKNGYVPGNTLNNNPTVLYYRDPPPATKGNFQERNFCGSFLPGNRGCGTSLGTWGSTAISGAADPQLNRPAMRVITIEFPGYKRSNDYKSKTKRAFFRQQVLLYAASIEQVFLGKYFIEEDEAIPEETPAADLR